MATELNQMMKELWAFSMAYSLPVSASKTKATIFQKRKGFVPPKIWINGNEIDYNASLKLLGIHLDHGLTWKNHIDFVKKSCMKRLILLKHLATTKWASSPNVLLYLYKSLSCQRLSMVLKHTEDVAKQV